MLKTEKIGYFKINMSAFIYPYDVVYEKKLIVARLLLRTKYLSCVLDSSVESFIIMNKRKKS